MKKRPRIYHVVATQREMLIKIDLSGETYNPVDQSVVDSLGPLFLSMFDPKVAGPQAVKNDLYRARDALIDAQPSKSPERSEEWMAGWGAGKRKAVETFFETFGVPHDE